MIRRCAVSYYIKNVLGPTLMIEHASSYHDIAEVRLRTPLGFLPPSQAYMGKKWARRTRMT